MTTVHPSEDPMNVAQTVGLSPAKTDDLTDYRVDWTIDVIASSPIEAAKKARAAQIAPGTMARVFDVMTEDGPESVDLDDLEQAGKYCEIQLAHPEPPEPLPLTLDVDETATILHALRCIQTGTGSCGANCDHFSDEEKMLSDEAIDDLCEKINCASSPAPVLSGAVGDFVRMAAAGNTEASDLQRLACDLLGREHPKR